MIITAGIYLVSFIVTSLLTELSFNIKDKYIYDRIFRVFVIILLIFIPSFFAGIREGVGTDFYSYNTIFEKIIAGDLGRIEIGYVALNQIVNYFGGNINHVFFVSQAITIKFVYLFLKQYKHQINPGLGMFLYLLLFYNSSLNIVRQGIAISIILFSFYFWDKRKSFKFIICILFASTFHISAIIIIPFYLIYNYFGNLNNIFKAIVYIMVILLLFNYQFVVEFISVYILKDSYYLSYAETSNLSLGIGLIVTYIPVLLVGLFFPKDLKNQSLKLFIFIYSIGFIFKLLPYFGAQFLNRIADYFLVINTFLTPFYYKHLFHKKHTVTIALLLLGFSIVIWFYMYIVLNSGETVPYTTIYHR